MPPHLEHEPQQEDHGHAGHDVRMVLHDELVAQHRRVLVALLADGHGGQGVGRRRRRLPRCQHSSSRRGQEEAEGEEAAAQPRNGSRRFASPRPGRREQPRPPPAAPLPAGGPPPHPPAGAARGSARQFKPTNGGGPAASPPPGGRPGWRCGPGPVSRAEPSRAEPPWAALAGYSLAVARSPRWAPAQLPSAEAPTEDGRGSRRGRGGGGRALGQAGPAPSRAAAGQSGLAPLRSVPAGPGQASLPPGTPRHPGAALMSFCPPPPPQVLWSPDLGRRDAGHPQDGVRKPRSLGSVQLRLRRSRKVQLALCWQQAPAIPSAYIILYSQQ